MSSHEAGDNGAREEELLDALLQEYSRQGAVLDEHGQASIPPAYTAIAVWVQHWLLPTVERRVAQGSRGGIYWCTRWWAHPEALQRIYALWREWEKARADATMSHWWRDHLDPHLLALASDNGAFHQCSPIHHQTPSHLHAEPIPQDLQDQLPEAER